jgi:hypothetical protein
MAILTPQAHAQDYVDAGNVSVSWKLDALSGASPETARLSTLTFRFRVDQTTLEHEGTYFAQQIHFDNTGPGGDIGYLGLQPRQRKDGKQYLRAVFSSFISGSRSSDANCSDGADGGDGVSCGVDFATSYGHLYEIKVSKVGERLWRGQVQDMTSHEIIHIGSWSLPGSTGDLQPSGEGFAEYYDFYKPDYPQFVVPSCSQLAKIKVFFGPVTTTDFNGGYGSTTDAKEYNSKPCQGVASGFSSQTEAMHITLPDGRHANPHGVMVIRGWVSTLKK